MEQGMRTTQHSQVENYIILLINQRWKGTTVDFVKHESVEKLGRGTQWRTKFYLMPLSISGKGLGQVF